MLHLDDELLFEAVHIPRPPPSSKKATQVVGVIAHLDGHLHKQNARRITIHRRRCLRSKGKKCSKVNFAFLVYSDES